MARTDRPAPDEYAPFYSAYVARVPEDDPLPVLGAQPGELMRLAQSASPERELYRYEPGKWSVRELFGHLVDAERVFGYRAFCISRGEQASLPAFDENAYVASAGSDRRALCEHVEELSLLRDANLLVLRRLDEDAWRRIGTANAKPVSVRALAFIMAGHVRHHLSVLRARYGLG